ncbi:ABC transporter permease [Tranquillimonas alkanivorans]|uniref:Putative spermidine/putrescine transport system permease protein n=1 Tax=Tranquillimonas alkanivorans TaxID=441119 RepID=A0A1I5SAE0_9RHOB|nr:ABC transporter permease [Tranquillimonas alkanivorans]SFP67527.1 putative spermidine/putrescine transport system permease protein [Tranquillimonas alkanivorans]
MTDATTGPDHVTGPTPDNAMRDADRAQAQASGPVLAADGKPLKRSLNRALRAQKLRALALIAPLLIFILVTFIAPIADMLFRSVENEIVAETLPRTVIALEDYTGGVPDEPVYEALGKDLTIAAELKEHTRLGSRLNYETTGISSLFRRTGRDVDDLGETYTDQFEDLNEAWEEPSTFVALFADPTWIEEQQEWAAQAEADRDFNEPEPRFYLADGVEEVFPETAPMYERFAQVIQTEDEDSPTEEEPWNIVYLTLYQDLMANPDIADAYDGEVATLLSNAADAVQGFETMNVKEFFLESDEDWADPEVWGTIKAFSPEYTSGYFLASADLQLTPNGIERQDEDQRIYGLLFQRTLFMSMVIMFSCILLGYPIAYLLSNLPLRTSNILLILVLLPFWTSLLVRTSSWKVLLQQQGVINDILVWIGLVSDGNRLVMINNQFGTIVAMTHILLPFMILPLYSVMKTIPPSYVRAAKSLGASNWTAFWRVYFPQSVPGIGAGCILVFILAIGYYITPELVGGTTGTFISNRIAYHISTSLNWGLAAALGSILLAVVLVLYWLYDKIVGIDNVSLG